MTDIANETPEIIYLIDGADELGVCKLWCQDPAPGAGMNPDDAVQYIRADKHKEIVDMQAQALESAILRKQAEAVDQVCSDIGEMVFSPDAWTPQGALCSAADHFKIFANRLRQQANDIEKEGE